MIFGVTAKKLISHDDAASEGSLWKCFDACTSGLLAFPLCVPGTAFYRCMQVNSPSNIQITMISCLAFDQ
jgi:cytochrome P450 family 26 subfamily A